MPHSNITQTTTQQHNNTARTKDKQAMGRSIRHINETYELWGKKVQLAIPKDCFPTDEELKTLHAPLQPHCQHKWFKSQFQGGALLHYMQLTSTETPKKGIIVFQHGIQANGGTAHVLRDGRKTDMALLQEYCQQQDFALYSLDMYGHGFSEGPRMLVKSYKENRNDLGDFCSMVAGENAEGIPLFVVGHSYGGNVTLHLGKYWQDNPTEKPTGFAGIILLAPAVVADLPPKPILNILRNRLAPHHPYWIPFFMPNPVTAKRVWRDPEVYKLAMHPKKDVWGIDDSTKPLCLETGVQLLDAMEALKNDVIPHLTIPFSAIHGVADKAVLVESTRHLEKFAKTPESDRSVVYLKEAVHAILSDPCANEAMDAMNQFIQKRIENMAN
mmetsp:Transcript_3809/g.6502  ORF Transcript_3809/g.6502 Transcript_3809/m.6502 type:complete len:385 (-) Transcript_3809:133-1287(-)